MKFLNEVNNDELLIITKRNCDGEVMTKEDFLQSSIYLDKENAEVHIAESVYAKFEFYYAMECLEDDMHEDWLDNVMNNIPSEVVKKIEDEINLYLKREPSYTDGEFVDWERD